VSVWLCVCVYVRMCVLRVLCEYECICVCVYECICVYVYVCVHAAPPRDLCLLGRGSLVEARVCHEVRIEG